MKKILLAAFAGLLSLGVSASEPRGACWTTEHYLEQVQNNPQWIQNRIDLENFTTQFTENNQAQRSASAPVYIIPVVFHILHNYGPENISDAQVERAVEILNRDYRKRNSDTSLIIPLFKPIAADAEIEFRLATIDPNGNCTNGIEHIPTLETYGANDNSKIHAWPTSQYLNIWTANSLENSGAAAYAHLPGGPDATDGIMCRYNYCGDTGPATGTGGRTLTHEIGHHFNLLHCWGGTNEPGVSCGDDLVADTPPSIGWTSCVLNGSVCNPPQIENVQNYMEYSYCDVMFTEGQKTRMRAALNSTANGRNNLWQQSNLVATGTDGSPTVPCVPIADFKTEIDAACQGSNVAFTDLSWNARTTSIEWSFPGGTPSTSTDSTPTVVYNSPGIYGATLIAHSATGSDTITKNDLVHVSGTGVRPAPYIEDFENSTTSFPGADGYVNNPDNGTLWTLFTTASSGTGSNCLKINNYSNISGAIDEWITPSMDYTNASGTMRLYFDVAYAQRTVNTEDLLKVFYSANCGQTWTQFYSKGGASLATAGVVSGNFTPTSTQWRTENQLIPTSNLTHNPSIRFKFQNTSAHGNNIYIDNIHVTAATITGVDEVDNVSPSLNLYPNPTTSTSTLYFDLANSSDVSILVKDILGKTISNPLNKMLGTGSHEFTLPQLAKGVYLVDVLVNNTHHVRKLVVS